MLNSSTWADIILIIHFCFVLGVVIPIPLIILGGLLNWKFVRNPWFRKIHLVMIGIVVLETVFGIMCPLTTFEQNLRIMAGQQGYQGSFIGYWIGHLLYYNFSPWVFTLLYIFVGTLILALYIIVPPKKK